MPLLNCIINAPPLLFWMSTLVSSQRFASYPNVDVPSLPRHTTGPLASAVGFTLASFEEVWLSLGKNKTNKQNHNGLVEESHANISNPIKPSLLPIWLWQNSDLWWGCHENIASSVANSGHFRFNLQGFTKFTLRSLLCTSHRNSTGKLYS